VTVAVGSGAILDIPTVIGKYRYLKQLGTGAFSVVVLVQHRSGKALFACKVVSRAILTEQNLVDRFEQELRILPTLNHPHIIHFEETIFERDFIFLIMEYCAHGDLFSHIVANGLVSEARARDVLKQAAAAVKYIHERDIAHRDLKLANLLLDSEWNIRVADFGLCHAGCSRRMLRTPCGSILTAAPEVIRSHEYDGKAADIWSLGICLYTMTTGTLPWRNANGDDLIREIQTAEIEVPLCLSPNLQALLGTMLQRDPRRRPTIDEVLDSRWVAASVKSTRTAIWLKAASFEVAQSPAMISGRTLRAMRRFAVRPLKLDPQCFPAQPKPLYTLIRHVPVPRKERHYVVRDDAGHTELA
jgi:serine/threonine protein kinase